MASRGQKPFEVTPEFLKKTKELSASLLSDKHIAACLNISIPKFYELKKNDEKFAKALSSGEAETLNKITTDAIEKSKSDSFMKVFFMKTKGKFMEEHNRIALEIKQKELELKEKAMEMQTKKFAAELGIKLGLDADEIMKAIETIKMPEQL